MIGDAVKSLDRISFQSLFQITFDAPDAFHPLENFLLLVGENDPNAAQSGPVQGVEFLRSGVPLEDLMEIFARKFGAFWQECERAVLDPPSCRGREWRE